MKIIWFICGLLFLGMMMEPLVELSGVGETYLSSITGIEDWIPLVFKLLPIVIPLGVVVMGIMFLTKGRMPKSNREE